MRSAGSRVARRVFDAVGLVACAWFGAQLLHDAGSWAEKVEEISLELSEGDRERGFREGVQWFSIYRDADKVGFMRTQRLREFVDPSEPDARLTLRTRTRFLAPALGDAPTRLDLETHLDPNFEFRDFEVRVQSPAVELTATGRREAESLRVQVTGLPQPVTVDLPLDAAPRFESSLRPLLARPDLEPGQKFAFELFDPLTMKARRTVVEYLGRDAIMVMGESREAHHLRQSVAGEALESWVNDLGEVLREELPGGLRAVRETEAEALWGLPPAFVGEKTALEPLAPGPESPPPRGALIP